jgi:hypothetical protein
MTLFSNRGTLRNRLSLHSHTPQFKLQDFFLSNFMAHVQAHAEDPRDKLLSSSRKMATKDKFMMFFNVIDGNADRHQMVEAPEENDEGNNTVVEEWCHLHRD